MTIDFSALSDGELASLSLAGRQSAFAELVRRHRQPIYRLVVGNIGDPDEALDLVQETFVAAYRALRRFDAARSMRTWLSAIAMNKCRDWSRRRRVRRFLGLSPTAESDLRHIAEDKPLPDVQAGDRQDLRRLAAAVAELPPSLREPLVLHVIEGASQAETASILGVSEKAVETRVRRARAKLADQLRN